MFFPNRYYGCFIGCRLPLCLSHHTRGGQTAAGDNTQTSDFGEQTHVEMDFSDFDLLQGGREVVAAFDPALVALHELGHAVLALEDDKTNVWGLGDCEEYVNHIRRELGLPERQQYMTRVRRTILSASGSTTAEVLFIRQGQDKTRQFYLRWEADQVGPIVESARQAGPHKGNSSMGAKQ
jgi:hypothetical protein